MKCRVLRRALSLSAADRRLALEALVFLAIGRATLAMLPFRTAMRCLGLEHIRKVGANGAMPAPSADGTKADAAKAVGIALGRASAVAPFRAVCLQQAVAAALMLRRRGCPTEVHFGLAKDEDGRLIAHAWSRCHGRLVTGGRQMPDYIPISHFIA
jgi:hypothetical protein